MPPKWKIIDRFGSKVSLQDSVSLTAFYSSSHRCSSNTGVGFREWHWGHVSFWYTGGVCHSYEGWPPGVDLKFANLGFIFFRKDGVLHHLPIHHRHRQAHRDVLPSETSPKSLLMLQRIDKYLHVGERP